MKAGLGAQGMTGITASGTIVTSTGLLIAFFTGTIDNYFITGLAESAFPLDLTVTLTYFTASGTQHALQAEYSLPQYYGYSAQFENSFFTLPFYCLDLAYCGDGQTDVGEYCDAGTGNGIDCSAEYGESCTFCSNTCTQISRDG